MHTAARRFVAFVCSFAAFLLCLNVTVPEAAARAKPASVDILAAPTDYPTGLTYPSNSARPLAVVTGDLNSDGKPDYVVAGIAGNDGLGVFVRLNNGDGTFGASQGYSAVSDGSSLALADLNGDGKIDIVTLGYGGPVNYLPGNGDGTFGVRHDIQPLGTQVKSFAVADFNGDGKPDIVVGGATQNLLLGNGDGTFIASTVAGVNPYVAVGDFNHDGKADIVSWDKFSTSHHISVIIGNGDGTFGTALTSDTPNYPAAVTVADLNNDGNPDVVVSGYEIDRLDTVGFDALLGNGDGTFQPRKSYHTVYPVFGLHTGDFDGDGKIDLAAIDGDPRDSFDIGDRIEIYTGNGDGTFRPRMNLKGGDAPEALATADFNGDGTLDLVSANYAGSSATVFLGDGHARFQTRISNWTDVGPFSVITADVNGDGKPDTITANVGFPYTGINTGSVSILIGRGDGSFNPHMDYATSGNIYSSLAYGDVTGDGKGDIVATSSGGKLAILAGDATGSFAPATFLSVGTNPTNIALADLNSDGHKDIVVGDAGVQGGTAASVYVLLSNSDGTYQAPVNYPIYTTAVFTVPVALADVTNDGKPDLVTLAYQKPNNATQMPYTVHVLPGDGTGGFDTSSEATYTLHAPPMSLAVGDLNNDGKGDIVAGTATANASNVSVLLNTGSGFAAAVDYAAGGSPLGVAIGDFTADGKPDIVASSYTSAKSSVFPSIGDGTFGTRTDYASFGGTSSVALADFNGDGRLDAIAASNQYTGPNTSYLVDLILSLPQGIHLDIATPANVSAGVPFDVTVRALDANNAVYTAYNAPVLLGINGVSTYYQPPYNLIRAVNGVAVFHNQYLYTIGTYQAFATSAQFSVTSPTITVAHGPAQKLLFTYSPYICYAALRCSVQPKVEVRDTSGNLAPEYSGTVTLAIKSNTGVTGAHLFGTTTVTIVQGIAIFSDVGVDTAGSSYQLVATSGSLDSGESSAFSVAPKPHLAFTTMPTSVIGHQNFGVNVTLQDAQNNPVTSYTGSISLALKSGTGTAGATLAGQTTGTTQNGVAYFSLSLDKIGTGYVLVATTDQLPSIESAAFDVGIGSASKLVFSVQPQNGTINTPLSPAPTVVVQDVYGNTVTDYAQPITLAISQKPAGTNPQLNGTTTLTPTNGVAAFTDVAIDTSGSAYTLTATSGSLSHYDSNAFSISDPAASLAFDTQPGGAKEGVAFTTQPVVTIKTASGAAATGYIGAVTLAIKPNTGVAGATLGGTTTVTAVNGVATFSGLHIDKPGAGYVLTATSGDLPSVDSQPFGVAFVPTQLAFTTQPSTAQAAIPFSGQLVVTVKGAAGATDTEYTGAVRLAIKPNTGAARAMLGGTATVNAVNGVATFSGLSINKPGRGYVLTATSGAFSADSQPFDVLPAGEYVQMALRVDTAATTSDTYVAKLTLHNLTGVTLPADTRLTFTFADLRFDPQATKADASSLSDGAQWLTLSTHKGLATLGAALAAGDSRTITLHIHLTGTSKHPPSLKTTLGAFSSNVVQGTAANGAAQTFVITKPSNNKAGQRVRLRFDSAAFGNGEPLLVTVSPNAAFPTLPATATKRGGVEIATLRGLAPGTYTVSVYGWYSGITVTGQITLS